MNPQGEDPDQNRMIVGKPHNKNIIDSDDDDDELFEQMKAKAKSNENRPAQVPVGQPKKRVVGDLQSTAEKERMEMDIESKTIKQIKFHELNEDVIFFLTEIYAFAGKLFITGVLETGQTINLVGSDPQKQLYFCLKNEYSQGNIMSQAFKIKAKRQIDQRLYQSGIGRFTHEFEDKQYVFQIEGVPRERRPYYKVRYSFKNQTKDEPKPDWEGQTFKFVFGTTYTPLELFVINSGIKGPAWVKVEKKYLRENTRNIEQGLCVEIDDPELIEPINEMTKPPNMRVMSISIKAAVPAQVKVKKLFNTNRVEDLHIYAISYFICEDYLVELKPSRYSGISRTLYLKEFGAASKDKEFFMCDNQKQMIALFQADIRKYDPDIFVCHDSSKVLDTLIQRLGRINDKNERPRLGRLVFSSDYNNKSNQQQRINSAIAGRLLVDTFIHSKDMIKSVDYELESMATHIKPERVFKGMSEEQTLQYLNENKTFHVVKKAKQEAEITFALMNHLEILQITKQLSNICGIIWKRSLENQRAERNEYLIMHDCSKRGLIIPDKFRKDKNISEEDEQTDRKKYQGGHVIDPMKGFYKDFILLLDFNSLYPSIIRQYNVCFSVIDRPKLPLNYYYKNREKIQEKKEKKERGEIVQVIEPEDFEVKPPPREECSREKWGFLPQLIDKIVDRRKRCKKAMKNATAQKCIILDIQQKCYKLVANSIYGCLGFSISRFYSKHLAALITRMGREALLRAKDIVGTMGGVKVIYGDTDSLMIQPFGLEKEDEREKLFEIKNIAEELKKNINKQYNNLQIDVDGIFKPLILLMKKKYVARKLTNYDRVIGGLDQVLNFNIEYKGIEVVRRDGFELARKFLKNTLEILMNSNKSEPSQTYEEIYAYAREVHANFSQISFKDFLFSKQLNKSPREYNRGQTIPHVKVALDRVKAGEREQTLVNHTIYYIVCKPQEKTQDSLAKCCFDDRTYERSQKFHDEKGPLEIDEEYYKRQLLQPVGRIIQHLEDFSVQRFLEEMGLSDESRKRFKKQMDTDREEGEAVLDGCISHSSVEKSKKLVEWMGEIECLCGQKVLVAENGKLSVVCPNPSCGRFLVATLQNRVSLFLKEKLSEYYNNKFKCRCGRQYNLNPIYDCCKIKYKPRSNLPFEVHEMIYVMKDLCSTTLKDLSAHLRLKGDLLRKIDNLEKKFDEFLEQSDFERVTGLMTVLKL